VPPDTPTTLRPATPPHALHAVPPPTAPAPPEPKSIRHDLPLPFDELIRNIREAEKKLEDRDEP
jgi:hypothetical protein